MENGQAMSISRVGSRVSQYATRRNAHHSPKQREEIMSLVHTANVMVWHALKPYLPPGTRLTSVYRPASEQLAFIVRNAKKEGYVFDKPPVLLERDTWIGALQFLRGL